MKIALPCIIALLFSNLLGGDAFALPQSFPVQAAKPQENSCPDQKSVVSAVKTLTKDVSLALLAASKNQWQETAAYVAGLEAQLDEVIATRPIMAAAERIRMVRFDYEHGDSKQFVLLPFSEAYGTNTLELLAGTTATEAQVVTMHMVIDSNKMDTAVKQLWPLISQQDSKKTTAALQDILASMGNIEVASRPNYLKETYDNILLTDSLLKEGYYNYASFSLQHVKETLGLYIASSDKANTQLKGLKLSVDTLSEQLKHQTPGATEKLRDQIKDWLQSVKQYVPYGKEEGAEPVVN